MTARIVSAVHAVGAVALACLSLFRLIDDHPVLLWSGTYFLIDSVVMVRGKKWIYVFHHGLALIGMTLCIYDTYSIQLKLVSRMLLTEVSTPLLNILEHPKDSRLFKGVFVLSRVIGIPIQLCWVVYNYPESRHLWVGALFWVANCAWYFQ